MLKHPRPQNLEPTVWALGFRLQALHPQMQTPAEPWSDVPNRKLRRRCCSAAKVVDIRRFRPFALSGFRVSIRSLSLPVHDVEGVELVLGFLVVGYSVAVPSLRPDVWFRRKPLVSRPEKLQLLGFRV